MACYHPLKAFKVGVNPENGHDVLRICSYNTLNVVTDCGELVEDFTPIPCGKCVGCRFDYSRQWANRLLCEMTFYPDSSWFLTLTYDNAHLPLNDKGMGILCKRDVQLFFKRLRKVYGSGIRFYLAGEYGGQTLRPHYHTIVFNLKLNLDDLTFYKNDPQGHSLYISDKLSKIWGNGFVVVGSANWQTSAYVARYVTKKIGSNELYSDIGLLPPFSLSSRRPGIGYQFFIDHGYKDFYSLSTDDGGRKFPCPDYFLDILEQKDYNKYQEVKERRKLVANSKLDELDMTDLEYLDYLRKQEANFIARTKIFKRGDCST